MDVQNELLKIATELKAYQKNAKTYCKDCGADMPGVFPGLCHSCKSSRYVRQLQYADKADS